MTVRDAVAAAFNSRRLNLTLLSTFKRGKNVSFVWRRDGIIKIAQNEVKFFIVLFVEQRKVLGEMKNTIFPRRAKNSKEGKGGGEGEGEQ